MTKAFCFVTIGLTWRLPQLAPRTINHNNTRKESMKIISGKTEVAPKVMITGLSGAGKSYLAATLPDALFLDIEGGLSFLDVTKTPVSTADELMDDLLELHRQAANKNK